ncbi:MAG: LysR family transcriptional regulator [Bdellovibrionales bacterium]|jgi:LysR family transcriptional activator of nhaA|nr:LysR family transcriptional regulator [Bdellovibrionales bacterium]
MNIYNYNHLFYFYVTAKLEGVTAAAKHLNTSQSSLSTQINRLEEALDRELFRKVGRRMELTDSGKEVFNYCRRAFDIFDEMFDQLDKQKSSMGIRISIGVSVDIERPFVTEVIAKVSKQYGKTERPLLNLISLHSSQLMQLLKVGEIDLLLTTSFGVDQELKTLEEFNLPVGAFASNDLLKNLKKFSFESLIRDEKIPSVLPSKFTSLRSEIDGFLIRKKLSPVCVFESNVISSVIRSASDGMGLTILPYVYVARELRSEKLILLTQKPLWKHKMALFSSRAGLDERRREYAEKLIQHLTGASEQSPLLSKAARHD